MSARVYCPHCGAEMPEGAPQGLCPKCLLAAGLVGDSATGAPRAGSQSPTTPHSTGFTPLEPSALRPHFPQLEIVELLGHGGMGAVYKARQPKLDRLVALKVMRPEAADDPSFAERFNREARLLARLSHPNIVTVYDFGSVTIPLSEMNRRAEREGHTELFFFLMEYIEGANLRELMQGGKFSPEQGLAIVPQLCDALQFAHDEGVVHRDIKPENILLDQRGRVKIADFGLAKLVGPAEDFELTATHQVMGTPRYMAPEQMAGSHSVDHRADIYSLGVVLYEMLTGDVPAGHFDPPSKKVEIDVRLDEVVLRALAREPERRYQHASDVKSDVESISQTLRQGNSSGGAVSNAAEVRPAIDRPNRNASTLLPKLPLATSLLTLVVAVFGIGVPFISWAGVLNPSNTTHFARGFGWWQGMLVCFSFAATLFALIATLPWRRIPMWRPAVIALAGVLVLASACSYIVQETNGSLPVQPLLDAASWGIEINGRTPTTVIEANVVTDIASGPYVAIGLASMLLLIAALETAVVAYGDRAAGAASVPHGAPAGRNRFAGSAMSELAATGHKWRRQHSRDQEQSAEVARPPFGFGFAIAGLFGIGWVVVGAMRHFGWSGFLLGILVMAAITYGVLRWRLRYLPELRAELSRQSQLAQGIGAAAGMIFFLLGMLALNRFVADARDAYYFSSHSLQPSGAVWDYQYGIGTPKEKLIAIPDARSNSDGEDSLTIESIDDRTCLHQPRRVPFLWGAPYAVAGVVLLLASVATVLGTRAYQYRWALHIRPALYVTIVMLLMLPVVVIANSTAPEIAGFGEHWSGTIPPISLCVESDITKTLAPIVDAWAKNNGYTDGITPGATGGMSHGDAGWSIERGDWENSYDLEYRSWDLTGTSALDRCQFIWGGVIRPRPPITVTWLKQSMGRVDQEPHVQTIVLAEFPWASNAELELWRPMMDSLQQAISRAASLEGGVPSIAPVSPTTAHVDTIASIVAIVLVAIAIGVALLYRRQHSTSNRDSDVPPRVRGTLGRAWDDWWAERDRWLTFSVQSMLGIGFYICLIMYMSFYSSSERLSETDGHLRRHTVVAIGVPDPWFKWETYPDERTPFQWKIDYFSTSTGIMLVGFLAWCVNWQIEKANAKATGKRLRWWHGSPNFGLALWGAFTVAAVVMGIAFAELPREMDRRASNKELSLPQDNSGRSDVVHVTATHKLPSTLEIIEAAGRGDATRVKSLLDLERASIHDKDDSGKTALMAAAGGGHASLAATLLLLGANVNERDVNGRTPLMYAAKDGHSSVLRALADVELASKTRVDGEQSNEMRIARLLAVPGIDKRLVDDTKFDLRDVKIDFDARDNAGETAQMKAAAGGHVEWFRELTRMNEAGDARAQDRQGRTVLMHAVANNQVALLRQLASDLQDVSLGLGSQHPPLSYNRYLEARAVSLTDSSGRTALRISEELGYAEIADIIRSEMRRTIDVTTAALERTESSPILLQFRAYAWQALGEAEKGNADLQRARELQSVINSVKDTTDSRGAASPDNDGG